MGSRLELHSDLIALNAVDSKQIYFQPPASIKLKYPCIIYKKDRIYNRNADNLMYNAFNRYSITSISLDPDNAIAEDIMKAFSYARFDRRYVADNLYHDVVELYY